MDEEDRYTRITLRIPRDLHARLVREADATSKSLNAEIVGRLDASLSQSISRPELVEPIDNAAYLRSVRELITQSLGVKVTKRPPAPSPRHLPKKSLRKNRS